MVHTGAQIDEPLGPLDQRGQDIGRQRVDGEHMRQAVSGHAMAFAIADRRVVNHGVEVAECIDLGCNFLSAGDRLDVADHGRLGLGQFLADRFSALGVAGVNDDAVALADEQIGGHQSEAGG